jgi:hypothetical protein
MMPPLKDAALVELELLTGGHKAWAAVLGALFLLVGGLLAMKAPASRAGRGGVIRPPPETVRWVPGY